MALSRRLAALAALAGAAADVPRRPMPEFEVNLDLQPEQRFTKVMTHFNASLQAFYKSIDNFLIEDVLDYLTKRRGPEPEELQREVNAAAALTNVPVKALSAIQMLEELGDMELPIGPNITVRVPWKGACTGIVAVDKSDGTVYHARNQDFSPAKYLQNLLYSAVFTKGGKELFVAEMFAGYFMPVTALKRGPDGYSYEANTRYMDRRAGIVDFWKNLFDERRTLNGWTVRKALETTATYDAFVQTMSTAPLVAPQYTIIAGVKKGTILARDPNTVAYQLTLGKPNPECRDDYIIITNFDYYFHDIREWFDPTGGKGIGHPRRPAAQRILNASAVLTPDVLWSTITDFEVMAKDTVFQVMINPEKGLWNASLPQCTECPKISPRVAASETSIMI